MALGRNSEQESSSDLVFLSPRAKKDKKDIEPAFFIRRKVNGEWKEDGSVDRFSGKLVSVNHKIVELPAPAKPLNLIVVTLEDEEAKEKYVADFTFKVPTRSLFNRLLNLNGTENVEISYFRNKDGYESFAVRQNGETVKAKWDKDDKTVPEVEVTVKKSGEVDKDYFEVNQFYQKKMVELGEALKKAPKTESSSPKKTQKQETGSDYHDVSGIDSEEIPF
jgi:hypothetical protein